MVSFIAAEPARLVVPVLLLWVAIGAHDVYRLVTVRLSADERRLFEITTGLRVIAGLLLAIGAAAGIATAVAPAMLAAAATLVTGSTWFEHSARTIRPEVT